MRTRNIIGKLCPCGQPAYRWECDGPVCQACDEKERRMNHSNQGTTFSNHRRKRVFMPTYFCALEEVV